MDNIMEIEEYSEPTITFAFFYRTRAARNWVNSQQKRGVSSYPELSNTTTSNSIFIETTLCTPPKQIPTISRGIL